MTAAGVKAYRNSLQAMIDVVRANVAAGRTAEQMVRDDVLKTYRAQYSLLDFLSVDALIPRAVSALKQGALQQQDSGEFFAVRPRGAV